MFRLHGFWRSSASYRVRIALNLKGVEYDNVPKHLRGGEHRTEAFKALNPQQLVPVLEHDGAAFIQSLAIIEYLDEIGLAPQLLPAGAADRAVVRAIAQIVACEMHPLCNLRVLKFLESDMAQDADGVNRWYAHWMAAGFGSLEAMASRYGDGRHCFGDSVTLADVCLVPQLYNGRRIGCDLSAYPTLLAISAHLESEPAFAAAHPDRQPDAGS